MVIVFIDQNVQLTVRDIQKHLAGRLSDSQVRDATEELEHHGILTRDVTSHNRFVYMFDKRILGEFELSNSYSEEVCRIVKKINPNLVKIPTTPWHNNDRRFSFNS